MRTTSKLEAPGSILGGGATVVSHTLTSVSLPRAAIADLRELFFLEF